MSVQAKICGLNDSASVKTAIESGADLIGMVFFPPSPRSISGEAAKQLAEPIPSSIKKVGLFVDPSDEYLLEITSHVDLDLVQLHGDESPSRVAEIKTITGLPIMKAIKVEGLKDIEAAHAYNDVVDMLLFDAKAPKDMKNALPGGNGLKFDWTILQSLRFSVDWMLAGGLNKDNVSDAVLISGAKAVDTSSGVEFEPGRKDPAAISEFLRIVKAL